MIEVSRSATINQFRALIPSRSARWSLVAGFWMMLGLISSVVWMLLSFETQPYTWSQLLQSKFIVWCLWGMVTPGILLLAARFSLLGPHRLPRTVILLTLSVVVSVGYLCAYAGIVFITQPTTIVGPNFLKLFNWMLWTHWGYFYVGFWLTVALEHFAAQVEQTHHTAVIKERLEKELTQARLVQVRHQMHPHFLFNTLNTISSQILTGDRHQAYDLVTGLAHYLRRGLACGESELTTVADELDLTTEYLFLIEARYPDRLQVVTDIEEASLLMAIPSLLLQPLVENAITHAVACFNTKTTLTIKARMDGDRLRLELVNTTPEVLYRQPLPDPERKHLGLHATSERLRLLYGDAAQLSVHSETDNSFHVRIVIPSQVLDIPTKPDSSTSPDSLSHVSSAHTRS